MTEDRASTEGASTGGASTGSTADLIGMLVEVTGEGDEWAAAVSPASRLEGDLLLESVELLSLADLLRARYGERVDLPAFFAELDIDELIALTVGDVAAYVSAAVAGPSR